MESSKQIEQIKEKIEKDKQQISILRGREEENLKQLAETHGIKSLDEAEKYLVQLDKELTKEEKELDADFLTLKKKMMSEIKKAYSLETDEAAEKILFGE